MSVVLNILPDSFTALILSSFQSDFCFNLLILNKVAFNLNIIDCTVIALVLLRTFSVIFSVVKGLQKPSQTQEAANTFSFLLEDRFHKKAG